MKTAFYLRTSSDKQEKERTIDNQRNLALHYIKSNSLTEDDIIWYVDDGISGANDDWSKRPEFTRMYNDIVDKKISKVWVMDLSRLARSDYVHSLLAKELKKHNVSIILTYTELDLSNPTDDVLRSILSAISVYEKEQIKIRTFLGRKRLKDNGLYSVGAIYGYRKVASNEKRNVYMPVDSELEVIRYIYDAYFKGVNLNELKIYLKSKGFDSWYNFYNMLRYPYYAGYTYNTAGDLIPSKAYVKPIVSLEEFNKLQSILQSNSARWKGQFKQAKHIASGLVSCYYCQSKYYLDKVKTSNKVIMYYRHLKAKTMVAHDCKLKSSSIRADDLEKTLQSIYIFLLSNPVYIEQYLQSVKDELSKTNTDIIIEGFNNQISELNSKKDNLYKAIEMGLNMDDAVSRINEINLKIETLKNHIKIEDGKHSALKIKLEQDKKEYAINKLLAFNTLLSEPEKRNEYLNFFSSIVRKDDRLYFTTKLNIGFVTSCKKILTEFKPTIDTTIIPDNALRLDSNYKSVIFVQTNLEGVK